MSTFNRTYRTPKFFLCVHTTDEHHIELEKADNRFPHYSIVLRGGGTFYVLRDGNFNPDYVFTPDNLKKLVDVSDSINNNVGGETFENTKLISFNSWRKTNQWNAKLLDTGTIKSNQEYSCVIVLQGSCNLNGKDINEMEYADLKKSKEYDIIVRDNSSIAIFELL